jgi:hypothetical protein
MEPLDKALTIRAALPAPIGTILQPVSRWRRRLMSALGHKQTSAKFCSMSGLPPKADIDRRAARCRVAAVCALCY